MTSSQQDRVLALLDEANPIAPDDVQTQPIPDIADMLSTVRKRDDRRIVDRIDRSWSDTSLSRPAAAAGLIILALVAAVLIVRQADQPQPIDTVPSTTTTVADGRTSTTEASLGTPDGFWESISSSLVLDGNGYSVITNNVVVDRGTYTVGDEILTLTTTDGSVNCANGATAAFTFSIVDGPDGAERLVLEQISDECGISRGLGVGSKSLDRTAAFELPPNALEVVRPLGDVPPPGRFSTTEFRPRFEITLKAGWRQEAQLDFHLFLRRGTEGLVFHHHLLPTPEDVHALFDGDAATVVEEPAVTEVSGASGLTFDYVSPEPNRLFFAPGIGLGDLQAPPDYRYRIWAVDVDGTVITIMYAASPTDFVEGVGRIEETLDSIDWSGDPDGG